MHWKNYEKSFSFFNAPTILNIEKCFIGHIKDDVMYIYYQYKVLGVMNEVAVEDRQSQRGLSQAVTAFMPKVFVYFQAFDHI